MSATPPPGLRGQSSARTTFRVVGLLLLVVAVVLFGVGLADFFSTMNSHSMDGGVPHRFWMVFVGMLMLAPAGWCLQAGFVGTASRYVAGETMPVVKDSVAYLTGGPFCSACGTRNDDGAKFCDSCGAALVR